MRHRILVKKKKKKKVYPQLLLSGTVLNEAIQQFTQTRSSLIRRQSEGIRRRESLLTADALPMRSQVYEICPRNNTVVSAIRAGLKIQHPTERALLLAAKCQEE